MLNIRDILNEVRNICGDKCLASVVAFGWYVISDLLDVIRIFFSLKSDQGLTSVELYTIAYVSKLVAVH